jgi:hypothetical protein
VPSGPPAYSAPTAFVPVPPGAAPGAPGEHPDQPDHEPAAPATPRRKRKALIIGLVVAGVLILLAAAGIVVTTAFNRSSTFAVGSCVKQDGDRAKQADCKDPGAFTVVSKEDKQSDCPDPAQPFVMIERSGGKTEVLCLRPAEKK